jgi:hypothetical protein
MKREERAIRSVLSFSKFLFVDEDGDVEVEPDARAQYESSGGVYSVTNGRHGVLRITQRTGTLGGCAYHMCSLFLSLLESK